MNVKKERSTLSYPMEHKDDTKLLYKGSRQKLYQKGTLYQKNASYIYSGDVSQKALDCIFKKKGEEGNINRLNDPDQFIDQ